MSWQVSWADLDFGETLEAIAYCGEPGTLRHKRGSASLGNSGVDSAGTATSRRCKNAATAGGFEAGHLDNDNYVVQRLLRKGGRRWTATGIDFGHVNDTIDVFAFCP